MNALKQTGLATLLAVAAAWAAPAAHAQEGSTLAAVKQRGTLKCGTLAGSPGFSSPDSKGVFQGFDADFCRATAAAVLGDASKATIVPVTNKTRFPALQSGEVDVLYSQVTATFGRDTSIGFLSAPVTVYDAQAFLVPKKLGVKKVQDLDGATVCVLPSSNAELTIADFFKANKIQFKPISIESTEEMRKAFFSGRCDVFSSDRTFLAAARSVAQKPDDYEVLPFNVAKSPIAPLVRQGDAQWYNIIRWVVYGSLLAEEYGATKANVASLRGTVTNPMIARLLGKEPGFSKALGLPDDWALQLVRQVGNYGEIFEHNLGSGSPLKIDRGQNRLYKDGGLHYPPSFL